MLNIFKNNQKSKTANTTNKEILPVSELKKVVDENFGDYDDLVTEIVLDQCFKFIYTCVKDVKKSLIISSALRQIEPTIDEIKIAFNITEEDVNEILRENIPLLKVKAYEQIDENNNKDMPFFPGIKCNIPTLFNDLIFRMDFLFEQMRNQKKLSDNLNDKTLIKLYSNKIPLMYLLDNLSFKDAIIIANGLGIIDIYDNKISFDDSYLLEVLSKNYSNLLINLDKRINYLKNNQIDINSFDYYSLGIEYEDLKILLTDTLEYLRNHNKLK